MTTMERLMAAGNDLADWDMEELLRGKRRDKNGNFGGRPTKMIPREVHDELARRVKSQVAHELRGWVMEHTIPIMDRAAKLHEIQDPEKFTREKQALDLQLKAVHDMLDRLVVSKSETLEISGTLKHELIVEEVTLRREDFADDHWTDDGFVEDAEVISSERLDDGDADAADDDWEF